MNTASANALRRTRLVAAAGVLALVVTVAFGSPAAAAKQVTPQRYVRTVCSALSDWVNETLATDAGVSDTIQALANDAMQATAAKLKAVVLTSRAVKASDVLIEKTQSIGTPNMEGGAQLAKAHLAVLTDLRGEYVTLAKRTAKLKTVNATTLTNELRGLNTQAGDEFFAIGDPLETLQADATLQPIIDSEGECGSVIDAYSASPESFGYLVEDCVDGYDVVDCSQPHDFEVYLVTDHPASPAEPYPGNRAVSGYGDQTSAGTAYESYMGVPLEESKYTYIWLSPDAQLWEAGDREIICGVSNVSDDKLTGSVKGTGA